MYTFAIGGVNKSKWLLWSSTTFFPLWQSSIICNLVPWQWITRACSIIVLSLVLKWLVALKWRPECPIIQSPPYSSRAFLRIECYSDSCLIGKHIQRYSQKVTQVFSLWKDESLIFNIKMKIHGNLIFFELELTVLSFWRPNHITWTPWDMRKTKMSHSAYCIRNAYVHTWFCHDSSLLILWHVLCCCYSCD